MNSSTSQLEDHSINESSPTDSSSTIGSTALNSSSLADSTSAPSSLPPEILRQRDSIQYVSLQKEANELQTLIQKEADELRTSIQKSGDLSRPLEISDQELIYSMESLQVSTQKTHDSMGSLQPFVRSQQDYPPNGPSSSSASSSASATSSSKQLTSTLYLPTFKISQQLSSTQLATLQKEVDELQISSQTILAHDETFETLKQEVVDSMESLRISFQNLHDSMELPQTLVTFRQNSPTNESSTSPTYFTASTASSPGKLTSTLPLLTFEMLLQQNSIQFATLQKEVDELHAWLQALESKMKQQLVLIPKSVDRIESRHPEIQTLEDSNGPTLTSTQTLEDSNGPTLTSIQMPQNDMELVLPLIQLLKTSIELRLSRIQSLKIVMERRLSFIQLREDAMKLYRSVNSTILEVGMKLLRPEIQASKDLGKLPPISDQTSDDLTDRVLAEIRVYGLEMKTLRIWIQSSINYMDSPQASIHIFRDWLQSLLAIAQASIEVEKCDQSSNQMILGTRLDSMGLYKAVSQRFMSTSKLLLLLLAKRPETQ
jgi:hypothetical protein